MQVFSFGHNVSRVLVVVCAEFGEIHDSMHFGLQILLESDIPG
jgi:hypothetical protein